MSFGYTVGSDECGYGAIAGPLVVCAAALPTHHKILWPQGMKDSKKLSSKQIDDIGGQLKALGILHTIHVVQPKEVDRKGPYNALYTAHGNAIRAVIKLIPAGWEVEDVIVDGNRVINDVPLCRAVVGADSIIPLVTAASILGKLARNKLMDEVAKRHPEYSFDKHQGYPTPRHIELVNKLGLCSAHRRSNSITRNIHAA